LAALTLLTLLAAACQQATLTPSANPSAGPSSGASASVSTSEPAPTQTATPSVSQGEVVLGPGTFYMADPGAGLSALSSYVETLTVSFDGTLAGQPQHWTKVYTLTHTADPAATAVIIETTGDDAAPTVFLGEAAGAAYELHGEEACTGRKISPERSMVARNEPASMIASLMGAEEIGPDTVDSIAGTHYTFDERAMAEANRADTAGELWVADDGGYIQRYHRTTTGDVGYFGGEQAGVVTWDYALTGVNQAQAVEIPAGCQVDAPVLQGAANVLSLPGWLGFDTASSPEDAVAYYQQQLPTAGWTVTEQPATAEGTTYLAFSKGGDQLNVLVSTRDTGTRVDILLSAAD
jgi:hypothetical protein